MPAAGAEGEVHGTEPVATAFAFVAEREYVWICVEQIKFLE